MISDELRKRLQELNRARLRVEPAASFAASATKSVRTPHSSRPRRGQIEQAVPGRHTSGRFGPYYLIECVPKVLRASLAVPAPDEDAAAGDRRSSVHPDLVRLREIGHGSVCYLDTETTGLSASPLFLVGCLYFGSDGARVQQFLALDYSQERAMLGSALEFVNRFPAVVSFNGKSFDIPYMRDRAHANRLAFDFLPYHVDLLHLSRRRWRRHLPDCRLKTLESAVCERLRHNDIPSYLIPAAYHRFVTRGEPHEMVQIVEHNALDLQTMYELVVRLIGP